MSKTVSLWRHRDFLLLWSGQTTSSLGNEISYLALPLVAGLMLNASPFDLGLLTAARRLPVLFASLPAGALSDRWRKRPVMITTFLVSGCAMATIPLAAAAGSLTLWQLYGVALVVATCEVFFTPAYQTYPLTLLGPDNLMEGNAKLTSTITVAGMAGQPVGGVLISLFGPAKAVLADALSYLAAALTLTLIRAPEPMPEKGRPPSCAPRSPRACVMSPATASLAHSFSTWPRSASAWPASQHLRSTTWYASSAGPAWPRAWSSG
ncbi:hypothetical protein GCM10009734_59700 [Nonomuraea bangladeshensis]